jgi:hypothetical protein
MLEFFTGHTPYLNARFGMTLAFAVLYAGK